MYKKTIRVPDEAIKNVKGKGESNIKLYKQYSVNTVINNGYMTISGDDLIHVREVSLHVLNSIGNYYSVFEHPETITTMIIIDKTLPFMLVKYKDDIQNKYRIKYVNMNIPQRIESKIPSNTWLVYSDQQLLSAIDRNKNYKSEVSIGRNTFYSSYRKKDIEDKKLYHIGNFRNMSVGYLKDIKIRWDPLLTKSQIDFVSKRLDMKIDAEYTKTNAVIVDKIRMKRINVSVRIKSGVPVLETFKSRLEPHISETIVIMRLDSRPDIRFKFKYPSKLRSELQLRDIRFNDDNTINSASDDYMTCYQSIVRVTRYMNKNLLIKITYNVLLENYTIKFRALDMSQLELVNYINGLINE